MPRTRALSLRAASECENARYPTCKCRCGGALHGAARVRDPRTLPLDDPHSPSKPCPKCQGTGKLTVWLYDTEKGYDAPADQACWKCNGVGRVLDPTVQQANLPQNGNKFGVEVTVVRTDVWWCAACDREWTVASLPHNPACPRCGKGGWWRRFA